MGYGYYEIPTPDGKPMKRGYSVEGKCHHEGCETITDRGMNSLCYNCTYYFCSKHMGNGELESECFAGRSSQVCKKCEPEFEAGWYCHYCEKPMAEDDDHATWRDTAYCSEDCVDKDKARH